MDSFLYKSTISATFEDIRKLSFEQKREAVIDETKINKLLDKILEFKRSLNEKTNRIDSLIVDVEKITWFNNLDDESLMQINDLISCIRDLRSSLLRHYVSLNFMRTKGIAKEEIKRFKNAIDDLKDVAADLESRFFFLPAFPGFEDTTKELSLV